MADLEFEPGRLAEKYISELACQYRDSELLCSLLTAIFGVLEEGEANLAELCDCFDLDKATGACLTALGELAGFPRRHCAAQCVVGFGFECPGDPCASQNVLGWCSGSWFCETEGSANQDYVFVDDELYRRFVKAQIAANNTVGTVADALQVVQALLGEDACLSKVQGGRTEVLVPRILTSEERSIIELVRRVIPVSLATNAIILEANGPPFGFACPDSICEPAGWCEGGFAREVTSIC